MSERDQSGTAICAGETNCVPRKKRILVVEDDVRARYILLDHLNKAGFEVQTAANGELALKKIMEMRVDAVILDLIIQGMKGVDLIKEIRRKKGFADTPIYVCTSAVRMKAWGKRGSKAGATRIYDKALTPVEAIVAEVVADLTGQKQAAAPEGADPTKAAKTAEDSAVVPEPTTPGDPSKLSIGNDLSPPAPESRIRGTFTSFTQRPAQSAAGAIHRADPAAPQPLLEEEFAGWTPHRPQKPLPSDPKQLAAIARDLQSRLHMITCERDALVSLLGNEPIVREPEANQARAAQAGDTAYQAQAERTREVEQELARLQQGREELNQKLTQAEAERTESKLRSEELERRLAESINEIESLKARLDQQMAERSSLEAELGQQLDNAKTAAARAELAYQEQATCSRRSLDELEALRRARNELNERLAGEQKAVEESRRRSEEREAQLKQTSAQRDRLAAQLVQQVAERGSVQSALSKELEAAKAAAEQAQEVHKEEAARGAALQAEAARLAAAREELNRKLADQERAAAESRRRSQELEQRLAQSAAELQRAKAELERHERERSTVEAQLRQELQAAQVAAEAVKRQYREETSFFTRSTDELEALRRIRDELNARLQAEREASAASRSRSEELEQRLRESGGELDQLKAELQKQEAARSALERQLSQQMEASRDAIAKAAAAYKQEAVRRRKFEDELAKLRNASSGAKSKSPGKVAPASAKRIQDLEAMAQQSAAELERVKGELDKQVAERARLEAEYRNVSTGNDSLGEQLSRLCAEGGAGEGRVRESISALARVTTELEKARGERRRLEQRVAFLSGQLQNLHEELRRHLEVDKANQERIGEMEQQLHERDDTLRRAQTDLEKESAERQVLEAQLRAGGEVSSQLKEQFNLLDEAKAVFKRTQDELETRLKASEKELAAAKARSQKQTADRQRLQAERDEAQRKLAEHSRESAVEIQRLQSALEVESLERRRLEGQALQARYSSADAARLGRAFVNSYRSQLRAPADTLMQSIRQLLALSLEEEPKKLLEDVLESALFLQTTLQDESLAAETSRPEGTPKSAAA